MALIDLSGKKFGRWLVLDYVGRYKWRCKCECGIEKNVDSASLRRGGTKSCGCLAKELSRTRREQCTGLKNHAWKGGKLSSGNGYVRLFKPVYPGQPDYSKVKRWCPGEHIVIMARHLGRPLSSDETVHHKNGIRNDNRIENLELMVKSKHPSGAKPRDLVKWASEILKRYAPEKLKEEND